MKVKVNKPHISSGTVVQTYLLGRDCAVKNEQITSSGFTEHSVKCQSNAEAAESC